MTLAWTDESRAVEGRPDAQEEAVVLFTMHAAKGLEWPIVIPVNTMTSHSSKGSAIIDRQTNAFYCPVLGVAPAGYEDAQKAETEEQNRERVRLWYVAATRARELLVLPRLNVSSSKSAWISLVDLTLADLPALDVSHLPPDLVAEDAGPGNHQTREIFAAEAAAIAARHSSLSWLAPSRDESPAKPVFQAEGASLWAGEAENGAQSFPSVTDIQGSRERGLVLHKLFEEVLTGEVRDDLANLTTRADQLIRLLGYTPGADPATGLSAEELADCVARTLALPDIVPLRSEFLPEFNLYAVRREDSQETATAAIADALTLTRDGRPHIIIDWKSDVAPEPQTIEHYLSQVRAYLDITGAERGMIVFVTSSTIIHVSPLPRSMAA
jgi:ATP-dependent exoDNAse (exonuclease V) beta subunit